MRRIPTLTATALGVLATACGAGNGDIPCASTQGIFYGQADTRSFQLSTKQQNAVVSVRFGGSSAPPCSGVLVAPRLVLTAAHCRATLGPPGLTVRIGPNEDTPIEIREGKAFRIHPVLDAGLVELTRSVPHAVAVPMQLSAVEASLTIGARAEIAGYGTTHTGQVGARQFATEEIVGFDPPYLLLSGMGESGACSGDSGGPVLWWEGTGPAVLGILKDGDASCIGSDRYTSVAELQGWVLADIAYDPVHPSSSCSP